MRADLGHGRREDHNLVKLTDALHELIHTGALDDVDIVVLPFNLDRDREISLVENLRNVSV